ncbi:aldehyde-activating protein [Betaproteobacteria bacterium GR16-43]|nr:aldehyde-activating protein [Betaproteobacteria bacterium GR16-43]
MQKTYHGSCHCGTVKFEADLDLASGTMRCNCSICGKGRSWLIGAPQTALRVTAGEETLADYQFNTQNIHHRFCPKCGIKVFGHSPTKGFVAVNVSCLDDATVEELAAAPVKYFDGKNDNFKQAPAETRYL